MSDGDLTFGSFECRRTDRTVVLDLIQGRWGMPDVRGTDWVLAGATGRYPLNRVADRLMVRLSGWVVGAGATGVDRWQSLNTTMLALYTAFDPTVRDTLTVSAPYMGLASGSKALTARTTSILQGPINSSAMCRVDIELECVDSPPAWA